MAPDLRTKCTSNLHTENGTKLLSSKNALKAPSKGFEINLHNESSKAFVPELLHMYARFTRT